MGTFFHTTCNITDCTYKWWVGWRGWGGSVGGGGGWEAGGSLHLPIGLFGVFVRPRSAIYIAIGPDKPGGPGGMGVIFTNTGVNIIPIPPNPI